MHTFLREVCKYAGAHVARAEPLMTTLHTLRKLKIKYALL